MRVRDAPPEAGTGTKWISTSQPRIFSAKTHHHITFLLGPPRAGAFWKTNICKIKPSCAEDIAKIKNQSYVRILYPKKTYSLFLAHSLSVSKTGASSSKKNNQLTQRRNTTSKGTNLRAATCLDQDLNRHKALSRGQLR